MSLGIVGCKYDLCEGMNINFSAIPWLKDEKDMSYAINVW